MTYTVDYFITKFKNIKSDDWTTGDFSNKDGQKCALGHCLAYESNNLGEIEREETEESIALVRLFRQCELYATDVNDGECDKFKQTTPKERILAALKFIKNKQK